MKKEPEGLDGVVVRLYRVRQEGVGGLERAPKTL